MMRRLLAAGAVIAAMMSISAVARADFATGNTLYDKCVAPEGSAELLYCAVYVSAISDAARGGVSHDGVAGPGVWGFKECSPETATARQLVDIVKRYLVTHPENRHFGASVVVAAALAEAFPCK